MRLVGVVFRATAACLLAAALSSAGAQDLDPGVDAAAAFEAARKVQTRGPADIPVGDQATLKLPEGYVFIPKVEGQQILRGMGDPGGDELVGLVFPSASGHWLAILRYVRDGHIADGGAREWDRDALLARLRKATREANTLRLSRGIRPLEVVGWAEPPQYSLDSHRLVWSAAIREQGAQAQSMGVNYNAFVLGRDSYISLVLVTDLEQLPAHKADAQRLLGATEFAPSHRYADFDRSTDTVAPYELTALVAGVAPDQPDRVAQLVASLAEHTALLTLAIVLSIAAGWGLVELLLRRWSRRRSSKAL